MPAAAAALRRIRTDRSGAALPARSEDVLEFVDVNFTIIVYTLTWTACVAGIAWSALPVKEAQRAKVLANQRRQLVRHGVQPRWGEHAL